MNRAATKPVHAHTVRDVAELERLDIARRIKQAREEAGMSQPDIADALGIHRRTYQNYEAETEPRTPWGLMNDIAAITGKTTKWLIHGDKATPDLLAKVSSVDQVDAGFVEFRKHVDRMNRKLDALRRQNAEILEKLAPAEFANALEDLEDAEGRPALGDEQPSEPAQDEDDQDSQATS